MSSAVFSAVTILLFQDGVLRQLVDQGMISLLTNLAILIAVILPWPNVGLKANASRGRSAWLVVSRMPLPERGNVTKLRVHSAGTRKTRR